MKKQANENRNPKNKIGLEIIVLIFKQSNVMYK
jgi:hypothetical protein